MRDDVVAPRPRGAEGDQEPAAAAGDLQLDLLAAEQDGEHLAHARVHTAVVCRGRCKVDGQAGGAAVLDLDLLEGPQPEGQALPIHPGEGHAGHPQEGVRVGRPADDGQVCGADFDRTKDAGLLAEGGQEGQGGLELIEGAFVLLAACQAADPVEEGNDDLVKEGPIPADDSDQVIARAGEREQGLQVDRLLGQRPHERGCRVESEAHVQHDLVPIQIEGHVDVLEGLDEGVADLLAPLVGRVAARAPAEATGLRETLGDLVSEGRQLDARVQSGRFEARLDRVAGLDRVVGAQAQAHVACGRTWRRETRRELEATLEFLGREDRQHEGRPRIASTADRQREPEGALAIDVRYLCSEGAEHALQHLLRFEHDRRRRVDLADQVADNALDHLEALDLDVDGGIGGDQRARHTDLVHGSSFGRGGPAGGRLGLAPAGRAVDEGLFCGRRLEQPEGLNGRNAEDT